MASCSYAPNGQIPRDAQFISAVRSKRFVGCVAKFNDLEASLFKAEDLYDKHNVRFYGAVGDGVTDDTAAINLAAKSGNYIFFDFDATIRVPEDYSTLQEAVDKLYVYNSGTVLTIRISSGHQPTSGVFIEDRDCNHLRISAVDPLVTVADSWPDEDSFVKGYQSILPALACKVDMNGKGSSGYVVDFVSTGYVERNAGVDNSGALGSDITGAGLLVVRGSTCSAEYSSFNGHKRNMWVSQASQCYADHSDFNNCTDDFAVYVARSSIATCSYSNITNSAGNGLKVRRAWVTCMVANISNNAFVGASITESSTAILSQDLVGFGSTISNNGSHGIACYNSRVYAPDSTLANNTGNGIICEDSMVDVSRCTISNSPSALRMQNGIVRIDLATISGCSAAAISCVGGQCSATNVTITTSNTGIDAFDAAIVNAEAASITGATIYGIRGTYGCTIAARDATVTGSGTNDGAVFVGSFLTLFGATTSSGAAAPADTNVAAFNVIDAGNGVIWA